MKINEGLCKDRDSDPDFLSLAVQTLPDLLKTDRSAWPRLAQYSLFEPHFFACCKSKLTDDFPLGSSRNTESDDAIAHLMVDTGLRLLHQEAATGSGNYPLNAAAILLSFPQVQDLSQPSEDNPQPWLCKDGSQELDPYWKTTFPWLEATTIERLTEVRLLQRKPGSPKTYSSLISCYHQAQFRRIAARLLLNDEEVLARITADQTNFSVKWGDTIRIKTEQPLFASLITSFYKTLYDALDLSLLEKYVSSNKKSAEFQKEEQASAETISVPSVKDHQPDKSTAAGKTLSMSPSLLRFFTSWGTIARWVGLLLFAWLPTLFNIFAGNLSFLQLAFGSFATNTCGAILTNAIIGYTQRTLHEGGVDYHFTRHTLSLGGGVLTLVIAVLWSAQENLKWITSNTYLSSLTNTAFLTVVIYLAMLNLAVLISYGLRLVFGHVDTAGRTALRYPTLFGTGLILFCGADILPAALLSGAHLNYSPTAATVVAYGAIFVPLFLLFCVLLGNQVIVGRFQLPRGWQAALIHFLAGIGILLAEQFTPTEPINIVVLIAGFLVIAGVFVPALLAIRKDNREQS